MISLPLHTHARSYHRQPLLLINFQLLPLLLRGFLQLQNRVKPQFEVCSGQASENGFLPLVNQFHRKETSTETIFILAHLRNLAVNDREQVYWRLERVCEVKQTHVCQHAETNREFSPCEERSQSAGLPNFQVATPDRISKIIQLDILQQFFLISFYICADLTLVKKHHLLLATFQSHFQTFTPRQVNFLAQIPGLCHQEDDQLRSPKRLNQKLNSTAELDLKNRGVSFD